jgi:hypothetical protein
VGSCEPRLWHVRGALPLRSARCRAAVLRYWQGVTGGKEASACFQRGSHELNTTGLPSPRLSFDARLASATCPCLLHAMRNGSSTRSLTAFGISALITSAPLIVERVRLWSENNWDHMFAQEFGAFCGAFFAPRLAFTSRRPTVICSGEVP